MARWEGLMRNMRDPPNVRGRALPWIREGAVGVGGSQRGSIVPLKPVKAGGGKAPWFWVPTKKLRVRRLDSVLLAPNMTRKLRREAVRMGQGLFGSHAQT